MHDSVPVNSSRKARGLSETATCRRCNMDDEDILHCFRDCTKARQIFATHGDYFFRGRRDRS